MPQGTGRGSRSDALYRDVCIMDDCPLSKARAMYWALRLGGWYSWAMSSRMDRDEALRLVRFEAEAVKE